MAQVGAGEIAAGVAGAGFVNGARVVFILCLLDDDASGGSKKVPVTGVTRRQYAIHHVDSPRDVLGEFFGHADPHDVARAIGRAEAARRFRSFPG